MTRRGPALVAASIVVIALGGCDAKPATTNPATAPAQPPVPPAREAPKRAARAGIAFEERGESSGLRFRMNFLPNEQGENFKVNLYDHGCGVAVGDYDGDGEDDVFFCNQLGPCALFRNVGKGTFVETTKDAGDLVSSLDGKICMSATFADVERRGMQDLYVTTTRGGNVFLRNMGGGKFRDATKEAGLTLVAESETPCFFDMDGDGFLDLLVTNTAHWTLDAFDETSRYYPGKSDIGAMLDSERETNVVYRNDGHGRFVEATRASGLGGDGWCSDTAVFDMDGDGALDVAIGNMFGATRLYRNDGKGRFADVTKTSLGATSWGAAGLRAFDYDGDGKLDLFIADMHSDMWFGSADPASIIEEKRKYGSFLARAVELGRATQSDDADVAAKARIRPDEVLFGNTLFRNLGGGKFEEVSERAATETFWPWGVAEGDFDGDGWIDAFIPSGMGYPFFYWRSPVLRNRGDGGFDDVCKTAGMDPPPGGVNTGDVIAGKACVRSGRSAATADLDVDGRLDIVANNFSDRAFLYRNVSVPQHWCELRLVGTRSDRDAIGAVATLQAGGRTHVRQVQAAGGYLAQSSNVLHFGLGEVGEIERLQIRWPSGTVQTVKRLRIDARSTVTEPTK